MLFGDNHTPESCTMYVLENTNNKHECSPSSELWLRSSFSSCSRPPNSAGIAPSMHKYQVWAKTNVASLFRHKSFHPAVLSTSFPKAGSLTTSIIDSTIFAEPYNGFTWQLYSSNFRGDNPWSRTVLQKNRVPVAAVCLNQANVCVKLTQSQKRRTHH